MNILDWLSSSRGDLALAGLFGGAVSAVLEWEGWKSGLRRIFVGTTTAYFLGPVGIPLFQWLLGKIEVPAESAASVGGFVVGVTGMVLIEILLKAARLRRDELKGG